MPSGPTHDRITLACLPLVTGGTFLFSRSSSLTLILGGSFLFSGLMFGPDLDIHSSQFRRWGWLRWIWLPYQKTLPHRSFCSHGPVVGTGLRLIYLGGWLAVLFSVGLVLEQFIVDFPWDWQSQLNWLKLSLQNNSLEWLVGVLGLELGAMSHSLSDWGGSTYKAWQRYFFPRQRRKS